MRDSFIKTLTFEARQNSDIVLITGDLGFAVLDEFASTLPDQFINAGVAEQNMTMLACGMALDGAKVFTYSIANFTILRCLEQIRNDVCYHDADVTAVSVGGGFSYGQLGMSHFATEDLAIMRALPGIKVVAPSDPWQAGVLTERIIAAGGPCYLRLDKGNSGRGPADPTDVAIGKAIIVRPGTDLTIFATGGILKEALDAAALLSKDRIEAEVVDMHTVKPIDVAAIERAAIRSQFIVTVEEHSVIGGLGGAVSEIAASIKGAVVRRIGLNDKYPTIVGDQNYLRTEHHLNAASIAKTIRELLR